MELSPPTLAEELAPRAVCAIHSDLQRGLVVRRGQGGGRAAPSAAMLLVAALVATFVLFPAWLVFLVEQPKEFWRSPGSCGAVLAGRGGFGDHIYDALWGLISVISLGAERWHFEVANPSILQEIFNVSLLGPATLTLAALPAEQVSKIPEACNCFAWPEKECPDVDFILQTSQACGACPAAIRGNFNTQDFSILAASDLRPLFNEQFVACLAKPYTRAEEEMLTVHLQGPNRSMELDETVDGESWEQPPCQFYAKVIEDGSFEDVRVVTGAHRAHACVEWLASYQERWVEQGRQVRFLFQNLSLGEDGCALARARHLVLSFSSLPVSFALLGKRARRIYTTGSMASLPIPITCSLWPSVRYVEYPVRTARYRDKGGTLGALLNYMVNCSSEDVGGPLCGCAGSAC